MLYRNLKTKPAWIVLLLLILVFSQSIYASTPQYYQIEKGDTLFNIASRFGVTVQELILLNEIRDPRLLQIGQKIMISQRSNKQNDEKQYVQQVGQYTYYQVKAGDTLFKIAESFGVRVKDLLLHNQIHNPRHLQIGQSIRMLSSDLPKSEPKLEELPALETAGGQEYSIEKVLTSTLTAYTAGVESTGKTADHPEYGITYSGKKVQEGRTIAVDPSVIPLGTTVYIDGVGLREAEDIGSAIKGSKIDIFMEDVDEALEFGVKKNVKVYVLADAGD